MIPLATTGATGWLPPPNRRASWVDMRQRLPSSASAPSKRQGSIVTILAPWARTPPSQVFDSVSVAPSSTRTLTGPCALAAAAIATMITIRGVNIRLPPRSPKRYHRPLLNRSAVGNQCLNTLAPVHSDDLPCLSGFLEVENLRFIAILIHVFDADLHLANAELLGIGNRNSFDGRVRIFQVTAEALWASLTDGLFQGGPHFVGIAREVGLNIAGARRVQHGVDRVLGGGGRRVPGGTENLPAPNANSKRGGK